MSEGRRKWHEDEVSLLREFWHCRRQWMYYRCKSILTAKHYEDKMLLAACQIVDFGLVTSGPMPSIKSVT